MSVWGVIWGSEQDLPTPTRFTLVIIGLHADEAGYAWPAEKTIAQKTGRSLRMTRQSIRELVRGGYLRIIPNPRGPDAHPPEVYRLCAPPERLRAPRRAKAEDDIAQPRSRKPSSQKAASRSAENCDADDKFSSIPPYPPYKAEQSRRVREAGSSVPRSLPTHEPTLDPLLSERDAHRWRSFHAAIGKLPDGCMLQLWLRDCGIEITDKVLRIHAPTRCARDHLRCNEHLLTSTWAEPVEILLAANGIRPRGSS